MSLNRRMEKLCAKLKRYGVYRDKTFASLTTAGCGGKINLCVFPQSVRQLVRCVKLAQKYDVPYFVLGKGSNTLASDGEYDGLVICTRKMTRVKVKGNRVYCDCGVNTVALAKVLCREGLSGGEYLYCLPATVGGAVTMNAGCFSMQTSDIVVSVKYFHDGKVRTSYADKCKFGYRTSIFKQLDYCVLSAELVLKKSDPITVENKCKQCFEKKSAAQPLKERSMGCVFYLNEDSASKLIDRAGLKGKRIGGAEVSVKHAGFIICVDNCTSKDVYLLMQHIAKTVKEKYSKTLIREVTLVGFDENTQI
ncbi:MAG: UDP-N-acetylmuramate dehydrogenase [Corallococcus sp.]|nr:UDP-N-acetylmuramate dehydrogenase [Corallococcus sp.]